MDRDMDREIPAQSNAAWPPNGDGQAQRSSPAPVTPRGARERRRHLDKLEREITVLAGHLNAAQHRFLKLIAEFDREEGWSGAGIRSGAHWLNWKCGIDLGAAREKLRVAHALEALPLISAAMAAW